MANEAINAEVVNDRLKLYQRLNQMTAQERELFTKSILYNEIVNLLNALENMKSTSVKTWKNIIKRFKSLQDMGLSFDGFDMTKFCGELLPMIGAAAGLFIALKESGEKESESSDTANSEEGIELIKVNENAARAQEAKSLILQYCKENKDGFSL